MANIIKRDRLRVLILADDCNPDAHHHAMTYYSWDAKARKTLEIYDWALGRQQEKPNFWQPNCNRTYTKL